MDPSSPEYNLYEKLRKERRMKQIELTKLGIARRWIYIVLSYYLVSASYKIWPDYGHMHVFEKTMMIIQIFLGLFIGIVNSLTFKYQL